MFDRLFDTISDEELIIRASTNHRDFARLYDRFVDDVYRFVGYYVDNHEDKCDLVSQVFMVVAQTIGNYQSSKSSFKTWLLGIARHKLADHRRSVYRQPIDQSDEGHESLSSEDSILELIDQRVYYDRIISFVGNLPKQQSSIFLMRYVEQLSNKEIALITQLDPKTISSVISMVTNKLRKQLIF